HLDDDHAIEQRFVFEFRRFLQESENEALLDRMVIIQVPYTLSYKEEARIYRKLISSASAFKEVHLDPHVMHTAAGFAILTRLQEGDDKETEVYKKVRVHAGGDV